MKKTIAAGVAVLALAGAGSLVAYAGSERGHGQGPDRMAGHHGMGHHGVGHRGKSRGPGAKVRMLELLETHDADGDGSVTQEEVDRWRADRLAAFDTNNDGQLSLDEYEALWLDAMRERMVDRFQGHDDDGDGQVTSAEFAQPMAHFVVMRDRNEDGVVNMQDLRRGSTLQQRVSPRATSIPCSFANRELHSAEQGIFAAEQGPEMTGTGDGRSVAFRFNRAAGSRASWPGRTR